MATDQSEALQKAGPSEGTLKWYLEQPGYKNRFNQLLGERAPQFVASLINIANSQRAFERVSPPSIIAAGAVAATLDLPIDKNFGFAWIIPYGGVAQFQIGYKGWVQLALRSGRYAGMNAVCVNAEALGGYDDIGDPLIKWDKLDETKPAVGYAFAWRLTTGFTKIVYWPKDKVEAHAKRYSQAYKANKRDSPWFTDFDKMALKTLVTNAIRRWGIVSVDDRMQQALQRDQSAAIDIDAEPYYPDNDVESIDGRFVEEGEEPGRINDEKAQDLAAALKQRRGAATATAKPEAEPKPTEPAPEASSKPASEPTPQRELGDEDDEDFQIEAQRKELESKFEQVSEKRGEKFAKERLEMSTGFRTVARVKEEKLGAGIDAMVVVLDLRA